MVVGYKFMKKNFRKKHRVNLLPPVSRENHNIHFSVTIKIFNFEAV